MALDVAVDAVPAQGVTYQRAKQRTGPVPLSIKVFQGIGTLAGAHKDFAFNTFLLLFYSQILGLSATRASLALAIGLVLDAVSDPAMGVLSDNFVSRRLARFGRRHLFMYLAAVPVSGSLYLLFSPPEGLGQWPLFGWLLATVIATRLSFTLFVVPYNAMPAELSDDYVERTSLIVFRFLVGWAGGLVFVFCVYSFVFPSEDGVTGQLLRENYQRFAWVLALAVGAWIFLSTALTQNQVQYMRQPVRKQRLEGTRFASVMLQQLRLALGNSNFRVMFFATLMFYAIAGVGGVFDIYMNTYFWEFTTEQLRAVVFSGLGALLAFATIPALQRRYEKQQILRVAMSLVMVLGMTKVLFRFFDIWPDNHDPLLLVALVCHVGVVIYLLTTAGIMFGSIIADIVDEQSARVGLRQEGVLGSAISFSAKAAPSVGLIVGGFLLDMAIGFPADAMPGAVEEGVLFRLALIDGVLMNALFVFPLWLLGRYQLTREQVAELQQRALQPDAP